MDIITPGEGEILDIELGEDFLRRNREFSLKNREFFNSNNCTVMYVLGSVSAGKNSLIKLLVRNPKSGHRMAVVVGDLITKLNVQRTVENEVEVVQIDTGKECHPDANLLKKAIETLHVSNVDLLLTEKGGK